MLILITFITGCEPENEDPIEETEILEISNLQVPEAGGVKLEATYTGPANPGNLETGFLISTSEIPTFNISQDLPGIVNGNKFISESQMDLVYNESYYVLAYVKHSPDRILYSEVKQFVSLGSILPEIYEINNSLLMDTVTIKGKYFTRERNNIKVKFDQANAAIVTSNDSIIKAIVPSNIEKYDPVVKVGVYGKVVDYNDFSLLPPKINSLSSNSVSLGDTLTIYGDNFDFDSQRNRILISGKESQILNSTRNSISFIMPSGFSTSIHEITLFSQLQETTYSEKITIKKPVMEFVPASFQAYEVIEITGDDFSTVAAENLVYFGENKAEVLQASKTKLEVRVPIGPYENNQPPLRIELLDYNVLYEGDFKLNDIWLMKSRSPHAHFERGTTSFVHENRGYIFIKDDVNSRFNVQVLDPTTETWSVFQVPYPRTEIQQEYFSIMYNKGSKKIFFYFSAEEDNFYEFSLSSKTFSKKENYPGVPRGIPAAFSIDDNVYLGLGRFMNYGYNDREPLSFFWSYNVHSDSWTQVASFPKIGDRSDLSVFVIDGNAYLGNGASSTGDDDFWKYSPATNEWIRLADFPGARTYTAFFDYGGKAYVYYGGGLTGDPDQVGFSYEPATNRWTVIEPVNDLYYTYFIYPDAIMALRFPNAVYLGVVKYPHMEFFKADLSRL